MPYADKSSSRYSHHGFAEARIAGAIQVYPTGKPLFQAALMERVGLSQPSVSRTLQKFVGESLLIEGAFIASHHRGPNSRELLTTPQFDEELESNPDWWRAARIQYLMEQTGMDEGALLDSALTLLERNLENPRNGSSSAIAS